MTPSKRRRAALVASRRAAGVRRDASMLDILLALSSWRGGPTPREREEAIRLALRIARDADRLASWIMYLECDREVR